MLQVGDTGNGSAPSYRRHAKNELYGLPGVVGKFLYVDDGVYMRNPDGSGSHTDRDNILRSHDPQGRWYGPGELSPRF